MFLSCNFYFQMGFALSMSLMPTLDIGARSRRSRLLWAASAALVFTVTLTAFLLTSGDLCAFCRYLSCVPLAKDFCAEQKFQYHDRHRYF